MAKECHGFGRALRCSLAWTLVQHMGLCSLFNQLSVMFTNESEYMFAYNSLSRTAGQKTQWNGRKLKYDWRYPTGSWHLMQQLIGDWKQVTVSLAVTVSVDVTERPTDQRRMKKNWCKYQPNCSPPSHYRMIKKLHFFQKNVLFSHWVRSYLPNVITCLSYQCPVL